MADEVTIPEVAKQLGLTHDGVMKLIKRGTLPARYVGPARRGIWLIDTADVRAEMERRKHSSQTGKRGRPIKPPP